MKIRLLWVSVVTVFIAVGCSTSKNIETASTENMPNPFTEGETLFFVAKAAKPTVTNAYGNIADSGLLPIGSNAGILDLNGQGNFLQIKGDSVICSLAYAGERQLISGYNEIDTGINVNDIMREMSVKPEKDKYKVQFKMRDKRESYTVRGEIYPDGKGYFRVRSSHRFPITYTGYVEAQNNLSK
ncbi:MAG: DUF4251 domain-containing protein [Bacteroidota bacterium]